jgi:tetratricopeptide (TPR) repeat protein
LDGEKASIMNGTRAFKQKLSKIARLREAGDYDSALAAADELLKSWPGNQQLYILWASLVQLQDRPTHSLDEAKRALQFAADVDDSADGLIELGYFLDAVEDDPKAASRAFSKAASTARRQLIDALLGQARALLQLGKRDEALRCVLEALYLAEVGTAARNGKSTDRTPDILLRDPTGRILGFQLKGPFASKFEDLVKDLLLTRSA